jgi:hypothetical protein
MVVNVIYFALLLGNLLLIVAAFLLGPRLMWLCRVGAFVNVLALMVMIVPLINLCATKQLLLLGSWLKLNRPL